MEETPEQYLSQQPQTLDDDRIGIADANLAYVVQCLLTKALFDHKDRKGGLVADLNRLLDLYGATSVGEHHPAPYPEVRALPTGSKGKVVWRKLCTDFDAEHALWEAAQAEQPEPFVALSVARLCMYVHPARWKVLATAVLDGPGLYKQRVRQLLQAESLRVVSPTVARPAGGRVGQSALDNLLAQARRVVAPLKDHAQQRNHPARALLADWLTLPGIPPVKSKANRRVLTDRSAVPARRLRYVWQKLDGDVATAIRLRDGLSEADALRRLSKRGLRDAHKVVRNRALVAAHVLSGCRVEAIMEMNQGDLHAAFTHWAGTTPAFFVTPYKTDEGQHPRYKPFPTEALYVFTTYQLLLELYYGRPLLPDEPLFVSELKGMPKMTAAAVEATFSGTRSGGEGLREALLSRADSDPYYGYSPHLLRSTGRQWVDSVEAKTWCEERRIDPSRRDAMGESYLDHSLNGVDHLYKDDNTESGRERLTYWAACICWEMLTTPRGAEKVPDVNAYEAALRQEALHTAERAAVRRQLMLVCADAERNGREVSPTLLMSRWRQTEELDQLIKDAGAVIKAIEDGDDRYMLAWPDDEEVPDIDLVAERERVESGSTASTGQLPRVRNWLTPKELATLLGQGESTVAGWIATGLPRRKRVLAWDPELSPIIKLGKTRRALLADRLNWAAFDSDEKRRLAESFLAQDQPAGWESVPLQLAVPADPGLAAAA